MSAVLADFLRDLKRIAPAMVDCYVVVDADRKVIDFNRAFFSLFPREVSRGLRGKRLDDVLAMGQGDEPDAIAQCLSQNQPVRFNDVEAKIIGGDSNIDRHLLVSSIPITEDDGKHIGAFVVIRDVSDRVEMQSKYQKLLESEVVERDRLKSLVRDRTKQLVHTNELLLQTQRELLAYKKGLLI